MQDGKRLKSEHARNGEKDRKTGAVVHWLTANKRYQEEVAEEFLLPYVVSSS